MALILCIETSTSACSISLERDGVLIGLRENNEGLNHSVLAAPFVEELLKEQQITAGNLNAVAVSMGPGSYTGLRIGVSLAKGICYGANIPLIAIPTLQSLAAQAIAVTPHEDGDIFVPMIDARRMEVYTAKFDSKRQPLSDTKAVILDETFMSEELKKGKVYFFGDGSEKSKTVISASNAIFIPKIEASAKFAIGLAEERFLQKKFENVAYFEPFYLKDFITTMPKKRL